MTVSSLCMTHIYGNAVLCQERVPLDLSESSHEYRLVYRSPERQFTSVLAIRRIVAGRRGRDPKLQFAVPVFVRIDVA
jgi:hypothetical protein